MARLRLYRNELGLLRTEDGKWGIRQVNDNNAWVVQYRKDANNPWDWDILGHFRTQEDAIQYLTTAKKRVDNETE